MCRCNLLCHIPNSADGNLISNFSLVIYGIMWLKKLANWKTKWKSDRANRLEIRLTPWCRYVKLTQVSDLARLSSRWTADCQRLHTTCGVSMEIVFVSRCGRLSVHRCEKLSQLNCLIVEIKSIPASACAVVCLCVCVCWGGEGESVGVMCMSAP